MSAPVTNQAYSQQVNQAFDILKYATPQQMQLVSQQIQQNPNSPEALAAAMAAQFQQQARAPNPQAPQQTILQQKLGEFQQLAGPAQGGLPAVGGNQMAMQQAAQQDPMRNAGIGAAPENTPAPQPQALQPQAPQQAATGGLVALAHGGQIRHFENGGYFGSYNDYGPGYEDLLQGGQPPSRNEAYQAIMEEDKIKAAKDLAEKRAKAHMGDEGQIIDLTGREQPPVNLPEMTVNAKAPKSSAGIASLFNKPNTDPNKFDSATRVANLLASEGPKEKVVIPAVGKDDVVHTPVEGSSAERNEAAPTFREKMGTYKDVYKELLGAPEDYSEEIATAKEDVRGANKEKWGGALAQGIGAYLSAPTQYQSRALGAGLLAGASGYAQGAKDESSAQKDLMALQMAHKKALVSGDKEAATILLNNMAEQEKAIALAKSKREDRKEDFKNSVLLQKMKGEQGLTEQEARANQAMTLEEFKANNAQLLEKIKADIDVSGGLKPQHRKDIFNAMVNSGTMTVDAAKEALPSVIDAIMKGVSNKPLETLGNTQPLGKSSTGFSMTPPPAQ